MKKCVVVSSFFCIFVFTYGVVFAQPEIISESKLAEITGQSGFSVSAFQGMEINLTEDEDLKPGDGIEEENYEEGNNFSFQIPQDGFSGIESQLSIQQSLTGFGGIEMNVLPLIQSIKPLSNGISIPIGIINNSPVGFLGGFF